MALISCPECGKEISDQVTACPHCGYPCNKEVSSDASSAAPTKSNKIALLSACGICVLVFIISIAFYFSGLHGDDKEAYDILIQASASFKDPSSVRLVSGSISHGTLHCSVSAKNDFGARVTSYYSIYKNYSGGPSTVYETSYPDDEYKDTGSLNIEKINRALAKRKAC